MDIDVKDRKILHQLDINARQSTSQISKKIGLHKNSTNYRIKTLENKHVINGYYTVIDSFKLGYEVLKFYLNFQYTTPSIENEIIDYFKDSNYVWALYTVDGWFDLDVIFWIKNRYKFYNFWEKTLYRFGDYFQDQRLSFYIRLKSFRNSYLTQDLEEMTKRTESTITGDTSATNIETIDEEILKILAPNARMGLTDIAQKLNKPRSLIKSRFNKLKDQDIIQGFRVNIDLAKLGYKLYKVDINLREYKKRNAIIEYAKHNHQLMAIDETVGLSHIELEYHLRNVDELHGIMHDIANTFPNSIRSYKYFSIKKLHKISYFPEI